MVILLLKLLEHLDRLPIELLVPFDHQALEREEIVHGHDLVHDLLVDGVSARFVTGCHKLFITHT